MSRIPCVQLLSRRREIDPNVVSGDTRNQSRPGPGPAVTVVASGGWWGSGEELAHPERRSKADHPERTIDPCSKALEPQLLLEGYLDPTAHGLSPAVPGSVDDRGSRGPIVPGQAARGSSSRARLVRARGSAARITSHEPVGRVAFVAADISWQMAPGGVGSSSSHRQLLGGSGGLDSLDAAFDVRGEAKLLGRREGQADGTDGDAFVVTAATRSSRRSARGQGWSARSRRRASRPGEARLRLLGMASGKLRFGQPAPEGRLADAGGRRGQGHATAGQQCCQARFALPDLRPASHGVLAS